MTTFAYEAKCVVMEHPDRVCYLVGFADKAIDTNLYLMLQRAFGHDDLDTEQGRDTFHVEWFSQKYSGYGGIMRFELKPNGAYVTFNAKVSSELGMDHISIAFQLDQGEFFALRAALGHIFDGTGCLVVADA